MLKAIENLAQIFLQRTENKKIKIISHYDTDGITAACIFAKAMQRLDKRFSITILKQIEKEILNQMINKENKEEAIVFLDLGSGSIDYLKKLNTPVFILDHHEIDGKESKKVNEYKNIEIINPHVFNEEDISGAGLAYLFVKTLDSENKDLANLAIIGMVGDMLGQNISKINNIILNDAEDVIIKKGLLLFSSTRPLHKALEFSSSMYIPGVTGNPHGVISLLREADIKWKNNNHNYRTLMDLDDDEMSRLITAIFMKKGAITEKFIGNIYLVKFFNKIEDTREISALINACSRLGYTDIALALCLGNKKARKKSETIYAEYKQNIVSALNFISNAKKEKIEGKNYVIINAEHHIKDTIIGTIASILSMSSIYHDGTIIVGMANSDSKNKIKISARLSGRNKTNGDNNRSLKEIMENCVKNIPEAEHGGHEAAAGCLIPKQSEKQFLENLKKQLEIEMVKV